MKELLLAAATATEGIWVQTQMEQTLHLKPSQAPRIKWIFKSGTLAAQFRLSQRRLDCKRLDLRRKAAALCLYCSAAPEGEQRCM